MNLQNPLTKMSKSAATNHGRIDLIDNPEEIRRKIKKAVTDSFPNISYEPDRRNGVANLINIFCAIKKIPPETVVQLYEDKAPFTKYLKNDLAEELINELEMFRKEFERLSMEKNYVERVLEEGWARASDIARKNMTEIKRLLGFL